MHQDLTSAQALALVWCIENQTPLAEAEDNGYLVVHYEHLLGDRGQMWDRIASFFGLEAPAWDRRLFANPSQQASRDFREHGMIGRTRPGWMTRIASADLDGVESILKAVGVTCYSVNDPFPIQSGTGI